MLAHDRGSGAKHERAKGLVEKLWRERLGVISTRVIQEFYVNVRRRARRPMPAAEAKRFVEDRLCREIVVNDGMSILEALDLERRHRLSLRDAPIIQAANRSGGTTFFSEDFHRGQMCGTVVVVDPFAS